MSTKAQIWSIDFMIALLLVVLMFIIYFQFNPIEDAKVGTQREKLTLEANSISSLLMLEGSPRSWNETNVRMVGLMTNNRLNSSKVIAASNISAQQLKTMLGSSSEFYVEFLDSSNMTINFTSVCGIGSINYTGPNCPNFLPIENTTNLISITRLLVYDSKAIRMVVYTWE